jgi:hypothetical protein
MSDLKRWAKEAKMHNYTPVSEELMASHINRWFGQEGKCMVPKLGIRYGDVPWKDIYSILQAWEQKGRVRIIQNPMTAESDDICLELLTIPGTDKPFSPNWIRDRPKNK